MEICVALGGGGFRGLAHVGALQVLEEEGYEIVALAGTSIGGIVAAMYAAGSTPQELVTLFDQSSQLGLLRSRPEQGGLIGFDKIETHLASLLGDVRFDELQIPLALTATNLETGHEFVVTEGVVIEAVMASMAVPGIFPPRLFRGERLVDGGAMDPVPVAPVRSLADAPVVAVVLTPSPDEWGANHSSPYPLLAAFPVLDRFSQLRPGQALMVFLRTMEISSRMFTELRLQVDQPEVIVRPDVSHVGAFDQPDAGEMAALGAKAMKNVLPALESYFKPGRRWRRRLWRLFKGDG